MKNIKNIIISAIAIITLVIVSGYTNNSKTEAIKEENQSVNLFVTHGHCSTPFAGKVENLKVITTLRNDQGNPLEGMKISFEINPNSFKACRGDELTKRIKTPGLFINEENENLTFRSTNVYTMGIDWYQVNGMMGIKGEEKEVKFFVSGIRDPKESIASTLVLEGKMNLMDWGIDYDKTVNGKSDDVPIKWMHINMIINL